MHVDRPGETAHRVLLDYVGAGYAATAHLLAHGHRRIGLVTCAISPEASSTHDCYVGYERAWAEFRLRADPALLAVATEYTIEGGYEAAKPLLTAPSRPTAIFAVDDMLAIGTLRAIKEAGLRVPEDIALVGCNDADIAAVVEPPLTSVATPAGEVGATAMRMLQMS